MTDSVDGNQTRDILVAGKAKGTVRTFDQHGKRLAVTFSPFGSRASSGISLGGGDMSGDGRMQIVSARMAVANARVRVWENDGKYRRADFAAYSGKRAIALAVGDVDGDGVDDIVTIPAASATADVRMFTGTGSQL